MSLWVDKKDQLTDVDESPVSLSTRYRRDAADIIQSLLHDDATKPKALEFIQDLERHGTISSLQRLLETWQELRNELQPNDEHTESPDIDQALVSINQHLTNRNSKQRLSLPLADQQLLMPGTIPEKNPNNPGSPGGRPARNNKIKLNALRNNSFSRFFNTLSSRTLPKDVHEEDDTESVMTMPLSPTETMSRLSYRTFNPVRLFFVGHVEVPVENKGHYPHLFLHPDAKARRPWNLFMTLSIAYFAIVLPLRIAFEQSPDYNSGLFAFEKFLDCCYLIEIVLNFLTIDAHNRHHGRIIYDFRLIAKNYVRTWFLWDVLSIIPFDVIGTSFAISSATHFFRLIKLVRMIRIVRLMRLSKYMNDYHSGSRIIKSIGLLLAAAHIFSCIWLYLMSLEHEDGQSSWADTYPIPMPNRSVQYVTALYFVVATIGTIGFGDIVPVTSLEKVYTIILMVFSVTMFAYFIGNISSILSGWGSTDADFKGHIRNLKLFMEKEDLPKDMRSRLLSYYDYCYKRYGTFPFSDPSVTDDLSPALKAEVTAFLNKDLINHVPILKGLRDDIVKAVLEVLKHEIYGPHDVIMHEGDVGTEMYFLKKGKVLVSWKGAGHTHKKVLTEGAFFGEMAMLLSFKRTATVTALSFCEVCVLTNEMFDKLMLNAPDFAAWIRTLVMEQNYEFKNSLKDEIESRWIRFSKIVDDLQLTKFETIRIQQSEEAADLPNEPASTFESKVKTRTKNSWYKASVHHDGDK